MPKNFLLAVNLSTHPNLRQAFFTRDFGNGGFSGQRYPEDVFRNRACMAAQLNVAPQNLLTCYQIHSPTVITATESWSSEDRPRGDALVTNKRGLAIGILTADCVPVLFADPDAGVIGAAHAGWRGAVSGILDQTVEAMEQLGARRKTIYAALGPCIWQNSYEVGPEFPAPFLAEDPTAQHFFRPAFKSDHYHFDLPGYVVAKLQKLGLLSIEASPADTFANPEYYFSHRYSTLRKEEREGNLMSAIALVD